MKKKLSKILSIGVTLMLGISSAALVKASDPKVSKYQGSTLPKPYLLHPLQFFKNREDVQNFTLVNSKLQDVTNMSLVCPIVNPIEKDLALFPNAKTIIIDLDDPGFEAKWRQTNKGLRQLLFSREHNIWLICSQNTFLKFDDEIDLSWLAFNRTKKVVLRFGLDTYFLHIIEDYIQNSSDSELIIYDSGHIWRNGRTGELIDDFLIKQFIKRLLKQTKITLVIDKFSRLDDWHEFHSKENIEIKYNKETCKEEPCQAHQIDRSCAYCLSKFGFIENI